MMAVTGTTGSEGTPIPGANKYAEMPVIVNNQKVFDVDDITASPYVIGIRKQENFKVIETNIPEEWQIPKKFFPEEKEINVNLSNNPDTPTVYLFFSSNKSFSAIYEVLMEVVTFNKDLEEKTLLFNQIQKKLQVLFDSYTLADFKKIKLVTPNKPIDGEPIKP